MAVSPAPGSPSVSADLKFSFPRAVFVVGVLAFARPVVGLTEEELSARISMRILDEVNQPIISDSRGTLQGTTFAPVAAPLLLLSGRAFNPYALQRPVAPRDEWTFSFQNVDQQIAMTLAGVFLYFRESRQWGELTCNER